ncbi:hypothetical protein Tco_1240759, partial [Tanacetum coccineum]
MDGFLNLVIDTWNNDGIVEENSLVSFKKKLQNIKQVIRKWIASKRSESNKLKNDHKVRLSDIDVKIDQGCATDEDFLNLRESMKILGNIDRIEASDLGQKSKYKWALEGDKNSFFFHGSLKRKRKQLAISGILKDGEWMEDPSDVKAEFLAHFRNRFQLPSGHPISLNVNMPNLISSTQCEFLEHQCTREEIKRTVWDCGAMQKLVFKMDWQYICLTLWLLFNGFGEFICHSNDLLACLSKLKLKELTYFLLFEKKLGNGALSVSLDDNLIKDAIWDCGSDKSTGPDGFTFDFYKKFWDTIKKDVVGSVQHFFNTSILPRGCNTSFIALIPKVMRLLSTTSSILINGSPTLEFNIHRGLRQGDPLSHFLFIIAMEGLHVAVEDAMAAGLYRGFKVNTLNHSHFFFADDALFIEVELFASITGCNTLESPFSYLGLPIDCNMALVKIWDPIIDKFSKRLSKWKASLLSIRGRSTLIFSVLGAI